MSENKISDPSTWVDKYSELLFKYAMMRLNNSSVAEDVVQETFMAALKAKDNFSGNSSEQTWFVAILKNKIIDHIRKASREINFEDIAPGSSDAEYYFIKSGAMAGNWVPEKRPVDWKLDSNNLAEQKEFWKFLQYCLSVLPKNMAMVFVLREMEEEEPEKICNDLKIDPTNLRVIIYRARLQLRKCLEKNWIGIENEC